MVSLRQTFDKSICIGQTGCRVYLLIGGIQLTVTDIFHDRTGKQVGILKDNTQRTAKISFLNLININPVIPDLSVLNIIEAVDQIGNCCLTGTGRTDKCDLLSRLGIHINVV